MPPIRPRGAAPDRRRTARDLGDALAEPRVPTDLSSLIRDVGGTRAAAALVGRSARTMRRWAAGDVQNVPADLTSQLARAGRASRTRDLIGELGGARRVAELTGRSVRTVQRWAAGHIQRPRTDAQHLLGRADAAVRMRGRGLSIDPATGRPTSPVFLQLQGSIRVNSSPTSQYTYVSRAIGTGGLTAQGILIDDETIQAVVDALGQSNYRAAQEALESFLSINYASVGSYDSGREIGLFIDSITSIGFSQ